VPIDVFRTVVGGEPVGALDEQAFEVANPARAGSSPAYHRGRPDHRPRTAARGQINAHVPRRGARSTPAYHGGRHDSDRSTDLAPSDQYSAERAHLLPVVHLVNPGRRCRPSSGRSSAGRPGLHVGPLRSRPRIRGRTRRESAECARHDNSAGSSVLASRRVAGRQTAEPTPPGSAPCGRQARTRSGAAWSALPGRQANGRADAVELACDLTV